MVNSTVPSEGSAPRVTIVVLGEIGQSPRMLNHARALLQLGALVDLVAYAGEVTPPWLRDHASLRLHPLGGGGGARRHGMTKVLFVLYALGRLVAQTVSLAIILGSKVRRPDAILIQVPPAMPTCAVAALAARLRGARLVIDWHNYGYTLLALRLGRDHVVVRLVRAYERGVARFADDHFCVSRAMSRDLEKSWGLEAPRVLYDRPRALAAPVSAAERREFFERLEVELPNQMRQALASGGPERPALLVSPTSWTLDENFEALAEALPLFDRALTEGTTRSEGEVRPRLLVILTGLGPRRDHWKAVFERLSLERVVIRTTWLTSEDFRTLLGLADLGLCFHLSSSGLDLPMKIVDMMAASLPVCAYDYGPCLGEQVRPGENGLLFKDGAELARHLIALLAHFPNETIELEDLHRGAQWSGPLWTDEWQRVAAPAFGLAAPVTGAGEAPVGVK
ncbi:MAG: glycosyltransferase [Pseudomonadota bacterium]